jgi:DNA primase
MTLSLSSPSSTLYQQAQFYHDQLPGSPAAEYLVTERGLNLDEIGRFGLGYSGKVEPGHGMYRGRLVIPYMRYMYGEWFTVGLKFRRINDDSGGAKYLGDSSPKLYNTVDAIENDDEIAICEGELDALTASISGVPAVGVPGVDTWRREWTPIFHGYERVWTLSDGDKPGHDFADRLRKLIGPDRVRIVPMPDGLDVNSFVREYGPAALRELVGK